MSLTTLLCTLTTAVTATTSFSLDMMLTREVRGAAYPVNRWNTQCSAASLNATPCGCYGGHSRRLATLESAGSNVVKLDLGGYASGSGLFFPAFRGEASSKFLADSGYDAIALNYRDFTAGVNSTEPTGGAWLASYLDTARTLDQTLPPAVVTNIDLTNDPYLTAATPTRANPNPAGHIAPWALIPMANGKTLALLSLLDPTHLYPLSPSYANRIFSYDRALASALARLRRLEGGPPDAIALAVSDVPLGPLPNGFHDLLARHHTTDATNAQYAELHALVYEAIGVDVVMLGIPQPTEAQVPHTLTNWANDEVLMVRGISSSSHGKYIDRVSTRLDNDGHLLRNTSSVVNIQLDCTAPTDQIASNDLHAFHERMSASLGLTRGYLQQPLDFPLRAGPQEVNHTWGTCPRLGVEQDTIVCGCRVSECPQGAFAADALQWGGNADIGLVNGGSIRATVPAGATRAVSCRCYPSSTPSSASR